MPWSFLANGGCRCVAVIQVATTQWLVKADLAKFVLDRISNPLRFLHGLVSHAPEPRNAFAVQIGMPFIGGPIQSALLSSVLIAANANDAQNNVQCRQENPFDRAPCTLFCA